MNKQVWIKDISLFEPGCIQCADCALKPYSSWDPDPEGFVNIDGSIYCEECAEKPIK